MVFMCLSSPWAVGTLGAGIPGSTSDYPLGMPFYQRLGEIPPKRHVQFRDNGALLAREVVGGEGDEVIFVHEGSGTIESIFGDLPYKPGDYVVIPRGTTYRFVPEGEQRYVVFESPGLIEIPKRYRNDYGQLLEHAPYYHRDIH